MLQAAKEFHARGDVLGLYRFARERVTDAHDPHDEGIARTLVAEVLIRWHLGSPSAVEGELIRAKALLRPFPADQAYALLVHLLWRAGENDIAAVQRLQLAYERLCKSYPDELGVQRWRGRMSTWLGRLALARGDRIGANHHYERSLIEFQQYEPDPGSQNMLIRSTKLRLAELTLHSGELVQVRRNLDECDGPTISRAWEVHRACAEVQYAIQVGNAERVRFWLRVAQSWATPQNEVAEVLTLTQAKASYAFGELHKARLLTLESRRLAAQNKQDHLLPEIREFFRVQASGVGAGQLTQGGIPRDEAYGSLAASWSEPLPRARPRNQRL